MDDLISRQAAIKAVEDMQNCYNGFSDTYDKAQIIGVLEELPPAQPEPKEGQWVNGCCNKCGGHAPFWAMASTYYKSDFCPHCGAKMKGAEHETD